MTQFFPYQWCIMIAITFLFLYVVCINFAEWVLDIMVVLAVLLGYQHMPSKEKVTAPPEDSSPTSDPISMTPLPSLPPGLCSSLPPGLRASQDSTHIPSTPSQSDESSDSTEEFQYQLRRLIQKKCFEEALVLLSSHSVDDTNLADETKSAILSLLISFLQSKQPDGGEKAMQVWNLNILDYDVLKTCSTVAWTAGYKWEAAQWLCQLDDGNVLLGKALFVISNDLSKCKNLSSMKEFYWMMSTPNAQIYSMFFRVAGNGGDVAFCEQMLQDMTNRYIHPEENHINSFLHALAVTQQPTRAEEVYQQFFEHGGLTANKFTFGCIINAWAKVADVERADHWLQVMVSQGIQPNVVTYSSVLHACARSENLDKAESYVERMKELGLLNTMVLNIMLKACMTVVNVEKAEYWMQEIEENGLAPDEFSYNTILSCCVKANALDKAQYWFDQMRERNIPQSEVGYNVLLTAKTSGGMIKRAELHAWLDKMKFEGVMPSASTFNIIMKQSKNAEDAQFWWDQLKRVTKPNSISFNCYAKFLANEGDYLGVENLYYEGMNLRENLDEDFFSSIFIACAKANPPQRVRAEGWFFELCKTGKKNRIDKRLRHSMSMVFGDEKNWNVHNKNNSYMYY